MSESPKNPANQERHGLVEPLFLGAEAPPLEGEELCICGRPEGEHRTDGSCPASGCEYFVAESDVEEQTRPDLRVEYEPGCEPAAVR